ncbi:MAG: methyltransferase domain-containing protein [Magnetococcales bacterium]|nr:methyltransferase domain-containing protein [Magnetococcales bacterium]
MDSIPIKPIPFEPGPIDPGLPDRGQATPSFCPSGAAPAVTTDAAIDFLRVRRGWERAGQQKKEFWNGSLLHATGTALAERLLELRRQPAIILDLGCRSGWMRQEVQRVSRGIPRTSKTHQDPRIVSATFATSPARAIARPPSRFGRFDPLGPLGPFRKQPAVLCADPTFLPFAAHTFDAVFSNMALHWIADRRAALKEIRRVLKPEGVFFFSMAGAETLIELRTCLAWIDQKHHQQVRRRILPLPTLQPLGDELLSLGFRQPVVDRELLHATFPDPWTLIRHLHRMGGCSPLADQGKTPTGKRFFREMSDLYQARHAPNRGPIPVTVEILFGHGWCPS